MQIVHQPFQLPHFLLQRTHRRRLQGNNTILYGFELPLQHAQWRTQFMGNIRQPLALTAVVLGQCTRHDIKVLRQIAQLVTGLHRHLHLIMPLHERLHRLR